jgi:4-azaleucine resistance transporter AzlC
VKSAEAGMSSVASTPAHPDADAVPVAFTRAGALAGVRTTLPLAASAFAFALAFGVLARGAGLRLAEVALMSTTVFSGTAQLVVLGLWATPVPSVPIFIATLIVGLRHLLLGATLRPFLAGLSPRRAYGMLFFLTDESWALSLRAFGAGRRDAAFFLGSGLTMATAWIGGSILGRAGGNWVTDPARWGLDFAFTAVFVALLVTSWRGRGDLVPWIVAAGVALAAHRWLPGQWYILLGALAGSGVGAWRDER